MSKRCIKCGAEIPEGNMFCGVCGAPAPTKEGPALAMPNLSEPDDPGRNNVSDRVVLSYIGGDDPQDFLEKVNSKRPYNIPALLFSIYYYFFRKAYKEAFVVYGISVGIGFVLGIFFGILGMSQKVITSISSIATCVVSCVMFFPLYNKKMKRDLDKVRSDNPGASQQQLVLAAEKAGGTSPVSVVMCISFITFILLKLISLGRNSLIPTLVERGIPESFATSLVNSINGGAILMYLVFIASCVFAIVNYLKNRKVCEAARIKAPGLKKPIFAGIMALIATGFLTIAPLSGEDVTINIPGSPSSGEESTPQGQKEDGNTPLEITVKTPEKEQGPKSETTPEQEIHFEEPTQPDQTGPVSANGYTLILSGDRTLTLADIPGMKATTGDVSVTFISDPQVSKDNLMAFFCDSFIKTGDLDAVKKNFENTATMDGVVDYETASLETQSGSKIYAETYTFGSTTRYLNMYQDIGTDTYLSVKISDYNGKYTPNELVSMFAVKLN